MKIGVDRILWTNDDLPELGGDIPLSRCLAEAAQAGYQGIEMGRKFPKTVDAMLQSLGTYGLELTSGWTNCFVRRKTVKEELQDLKEHLQLLQGCGCQVVVLCEVSDAVHQTPLGLSQRPKLKDREWEHFINKLSLLAECIWAEYGLSISYHQHLGSTVQSLDDIDKLMTMTNEYVGLLCDTGHLAYAGIDIFRVIQDYGSRINHVHLKDIRPDRLYAAKKEDWPFLKAIPAGCFTVPGDGVIDFKQVIQLLQQAQYQGWLVVEAEQDPKQANPLEYAKKGYQTVRKILTSLGYPKLTAKSIA